LDGAGGAGQAAAAAAVSWAVADELAPYVPVDEDQAVAARRAPVHTLGSVAAPMWAAVKRAADEANGAGRSGTPGMGGGGGAPSLFIRPLSRLFVRQLRVDPAAAVAAFDEWRAECCVVVRPAGRLTLGAAVPARASPSGRAVPGPLRAVTCRLLPTHWHMAVPIELQLLAWSRDITEVDLRPRGRGRWAVLVPPGWYFDAGHAVLDVVLHELRTRAHPGQRPTGSGG
jgi:hypothetical protein